MKCFDASPELSDTYGLRIYTPLTVSHFVVADNKFANLFARIIVGRARNNTVVEENFFASNDIGIDIRDDF
jgi:hypothetical protein